MRYRVHGISRNTGAATTLVIDAKHHEAAVTIAQRQLIVSDVMPEGGLAEPEIFDRNAADGIAVIPVPIPTPIQPSAPSRLNRKLIWLIVATILVAVLGVVLVRHRV